MICTYNVRIDAWDRNTYFDKKRKQHQSPADDASTAETATGRVRRGEQGEAWRANSRPNVGSHLELGRLRLKTWCKIDFSIAHTTSQHCRTCVHYLKQPTPSYPPPGAPVSPYRSLAAPSPAQRDGSVERSATSARSLSRGTRGLHSPLSGATTEISSARF